MILLAMMKTSTATSTTTKTTAKILLITINTNKIYKKSKSLMMAHIEQISIQKPKGAALALNLQQKRFLGEEER